MNEILRLVIGGLFSAILVFTLIPKIIRISKRGNLFANSNERTLHKYDIPTLGGIAIFFGVIFPCSLLIEGANFSEFGVIFATIIILLYVGVYDDIFEISAPKKLLVQISVAIILVVWSDVRVSSLYGLVGIEELPYGISYVFTIVAIVGIVNSINLVDGIDGLASGLCTVAALSFGIIEYNIGHLNYAILCFVIGGALMPFIFFNVFAVKNKMFMGDTGALILGTLFAVIAVDIIEAAPVVESVLGVKSVHALVLSVVLIPIIDTLRVFSVRILRGRSPFAPGKDHIHHALLHLGYIHIQATGFIVGSAVLAIGINILLQFAPLSEEIILGLTLCLGLLLTLIPFVVIHCLKKNEEAENLRRVHVVNRRRSARLNQLMLLISRFMDRFGSKYHEENLDE